MNEAAQHKTGADNARCVLESWGEWDIEERERGIILCDETRLELRHVIPGCDPVQLETLIAHATDVMRTSASPADAFRMVPGRWTL